MTVWIVVSILAVVLSPLAWLRPSRRQSGQIALRMEARRMGLGMQLAPQEWPHWMDPQPPSPCAQYHRPRRGTAGLLGLLAKCAGHVGQPMARSLCGPGLARALSYAAGQCVQGRGRPADDRLVLGRAWRSQCFARHCRGTQGAGVKHDLRRNGQVVEKQAIKSPTGSGWVGQAGR